MKKIEKYLELPHRETITSYNTLATKPFDYQKTEIMSNKKQTAVKWLFNNLKSHFEHDGDLLEAVQMSFQKAKEMKKEQHGKL